MVVLDAALLFSIAAILTALSTVVWSFRRKP